jgi:hypothetical protein
MGTSQERIITSVVEAVCPEQAALFSALLACIDGV